MAHRYVNRAVLLTLFVLLMGVVYVIGTLLGMFMEFIIPE